MNRSRLFGYGGGPRTGVAALCGVLLAALLLAGCQTADPDRHGAGEKLTETAGRSDTDPDAPTGDLVGERLPDLELSWLRPPVGDSAADGASGPGDSRAGDSRAGDSRAGDSGASAAGDPVRLRSLAGGEPLVINVWAVWCTPCRDEIPHLQRLSEQAGDRLRVIGVDHDDDPDAANDLLDDLGVDYPQLADPDAELRAPFRLGIGIPVTVYVRPDGEIAHVARTPYRSLEQLRADTERYLGVAI